MNKKILYVEDYEHSREYFRKLVNSLGASDVLIPTSLLDCKELIEKNEFRGAIIDNRLTHWLRSDDEPITIDGLQCNNGVKIAKVLINRFKGIKIGMYSSSTPDLETQIRNLGLDNDYNDMEVIKGEIKYKPNEHLKIYLEKFYEINTFVEPVNGDFNAVPPSIQIYYANKIINSGNKGQFIWKAGDFSWMVGVNSKLESHIYNNSIKKDSDKIITEKYKIKWNKEFLYPEKILVEDIDGFKDHTEIFKIKQKLNLVNNTYLSEVFTAQFWTNKYLYQEINFNKFIRELNSHDDFVKLKSQQILFRDKSKKFGNKEDIYIELQKYWDYKLPKILEIFECRVEEVVENKAYIKFTSVSNKDISRVEVFDINFIKRNYLEEDSNFQYCIYRTPFDARSTLIELI